MSCIGHAVSLQGNCCDTAVLHYCGVGLGENRKVAAAGATAVDHNKANIVSQMYLNQKGILFVVVATVQW